MHPADRLEQPQVRAAQPVLVGDPDQHRRPRVGDLVHRVAEPGDQPPGLRGPAAPRPARSRPSPRRRLAAALAAGQRVGQEPAGVLGHAEEPGPAAEQAGRERALHRVRRASGT